MKKVLGLLMVLLVFTANSQSKTPKTKTVEIKTSVICECHGNLINKLNR